MLYWIVTDIKQYLEVFNFVDMQTELFEIELFNHLTVCKQKTVFKQMTVCKPETVLMLNRTVWSFYCVFVLNRNKWNHLTLWKKWAQACLKILILYLICIKGFGIK